MQAGCNCVGTNCQLGAPKTVPNMDSCCSRFTAPEGGARLAAVAAEKNTLAVEYASFVSTRLLYEDAYKIRGPLSKGFKRSVYITRASRVPCVAYELHILTDLTAVKALEYGDLEDWGQTLEEKQVVVCTSRVMKGILEDGVLTIPQLNVLIIDSCHLIFEDQDLQYVMKCYKQCKESEQPRILALTYPLFTPSKDPEAPTDSNDKQENTDKVANVDETGSNVRDDIDDRKAEVVSKIDDDDGVRIIELKDDQNDEKTKEEARTGDDNKHAVDSELVKEINGEVIEIKDSNKETKEGSNEETKHNLPKSASGKIDKDIQENTDSCIDTQSIDEDNVGSEGTEVKSDVDAVEAVDVKREMQDSGVSESDRDGAHSRLEWRLEQLEAALRCAADLAEDVDAGKRLANTVAKPKEVLIEFNPKAPPEATPKACLELENFMRQEVAGVVAFMDEHRYDPSEIYGDELYEEFVNIPDPTIDPKVMFNQFLYVLDQLGPYAADKAAFSLLVKLEKLKIKVPYERHFLLLCLCTSVFTKIRCYADLVLSKFGDWDKIRLFSTPKVLRFAEILEQFQTPEQLAAANHNDEASKRNDVTNDVINEINGKESEINKIDGKESKIDEIDGKESNIGEEATGETISKKNGNKKAETVRDTQAIYNNESVSYKNEPNSEDATEFNEHVEKLDNQEECVEVSHNDLTEYRRITELETILNDVKNVNNKNEKDCNAAISNNFDTFKAKNNVEDKDLHENKFTEEVAKKTETGEEMEKAPKSKLVKSKTMELLDDLEKCDFVTLGNRIEDRVHTYEANLKDLDIIDDDKSEIVDKDNIAGTVDEVDNTIVDDKDQNVDITKTNNQDTLKPENNLDSKTKIRKADLTKLKTDTEFKREAIETKIDFNDKDIDEKAMRKLKDDEKCKKEANNSKTDTKLAVDIAKTTNLDTTDPKSKEVDAKKSKESKTELKTPATDPKVKTKVDPPDPKGKVGKGGVRRHRVGGRRGGGHAARLQLLQQSPDALCAVVFMRDPLLASVMFMLVVDMSRSRPSLSHLCAQYCAVESDGDECRPQKKHEDVLKKFRMHECNLLLATPALEEGIDLPRCNLVVRWDLPPSYRSHGLCRSRARAPRSVLALMAEVNSTSEILLDNLSVYKELDQIISRKCGCGIQNEPPAAEEVHADIFTSVIKPYTPVEAKESKHDDKLTKDNDGAKDKDRRDMEKDVQSEIGLNGAKEIDERETDIDMIVKSENDGLKDTEKGLGGERRDMSVLKPSEIDIKSDEELVIYKDGSMTIDAAKETDINDSGNNIAAIIDVESNNDTKIIDIVNDSRNDSKNDEDIAASNDKVSEVVNNVNEIGNDSTNSDVNDDKAKNESDNDKVDRFIIKESVDGITKKLIRTEVIIPNNENKSVNEKLNEAKINEIKSALNEMKPEVIPEDVNVTVDSVKDFNIKYNFCGKRECGSWCKCKLDGRREVSRERKSEEDICSVDLSTAIALINRYCGKLPSDTFTRLAPQYWMEEVQIPHTQTETRAAYVCTLRLPLNCPVKYNIVGHPMPTRVLARRMVALQACRILHKSGELDNQLMPIGKENFKAAELESTAHSDSENNDSARPGTTKRRQYYYKRTASAFTDCQPLIDSTDADIELQPWDEAKESYNARFPPDTKRNRLFALSSRLWCALPERYNTRGRRLHAPQHAPHAQAVLMATAHPHALQIPAFPVYTRSGEVRVSIEPAHQADVRMSPRRAKLVRRFMRFVFSDVLRVRRRGMRLQTEGSTHNNYYIVPTVRVPHEDGSSHVDIDWAFLELIFQHTEEKKNSVEKPVLLHQDDEEDEEEVVEKKPKREREKDGKVKKMDNPFLKPGEVFVFDAEKYRDAVVTPWYRNQDQPQYFLVAEICWNLSPDSAFPSVSHGSFRDYYSSKYGVTLTQPDQPLLDVDHTSARLNLLTPRYVNRKGVALPVSSERTRRAKRDRLDQKQILVPELCTVHPFAAPLWFATVALPCVLYRINALLIADEIRRAVSADVALGAPAVRGVPPPRWPPLDFGWSLAEVLNTDEKGDKSERKKEDVGSKKEIKHTTEDRKEGSSGEETQETVEVQEKTINDILQEKEDAESGFEIGTWSNDMASSIPQAEYDEYMEPLPPNLTFCTSASGGANWSEPIQKPKTPFGASKAFSMAESDCSYLSSDFDTDDSDLNSDGSEEDLDSSGFGSRNYASMGVRIEYKTAHEAEAVDLERKVKASSAPQFDRADDALDLVAQRRLMKHATPPQEYIEKYRNSVLKHKNEIRTHRLIAKDEPIKDLLPDTAKEMETLRKELNKKLKRRRIHEITKEVLTTGTIRDDDVVIDSESGVLVLDTNVRGTKNVDVCIDNDVKFNDIDCTVGKEQNCIGDRLSVVKTDKVNRINKVITELSKNCTDSKSKQVKVTKEVGNVTAIIETTGVNNAVGNKENLKDIILKDTDRTNVNNIDTILQGSDVNLDASAIKDTAREIDFDRSKMTDETKESHFDASKLTDKTKESIFETSKLTDKTNADEFKKELLDEIFPYSNALEFQNGQVTLESIERNKREILSKFKSTLSKEEIEKFNCFSMLDIDIDSPDYVNEKVANVGFDTKESYIERVSGKSERQHVPYYQDSKAQSGAQFDFDYQPRLEGHPGPSPSVILQALTMSNANDGINLERLETIGDSFLKFAITAYLYCAHPAVHEGKLSHMRSKQVSNLNLYRLGRNKRLGARMIASKFEPHDNWLPPCHKPPPTHHPTSGEQESQMQKEAATDNTGCFIPYNLITQHSIPDKSIADCVEALIGAYLLECGPRGALLFMAWLGIAVLPKHCLPLPPDHPAATLKPPTPPSPKQSYSSSSISYSSDSSCASSDDELEAEAPQAAECEASWRGRPVGSLRPRRDETGQWVQTVFGELRAPPSPLLRYVEDPEGELERMLSGYDALERTLQYRFRDRSLLLQALTHASHQQNRLTDCYQRLEFLGDAILDYLITRHLYEDARRHSPGALTDLRSALVNNTIFATLAARHGFHKYFRHMSPGLNEVLTKYVKIQEENGHSISEEHYLIQEDEMEQAEDVEVPKALGDLFESVAGAIFLDSGMSLSAVWQSYVRLMGAELEAFSAAAPKSPVRELLEAEPDTAKFGKPERLADGRRVRVCVEVFGRGAFKGIGRNYRIAKGTAARCALRHLRATRDQRR